MEIDFHESEIKRTKREKPRRHKYFFIGVLAVIILLAGLVLLIRGYFQYASENENSSLNSYILTILPNNTLSEIRELAFSDVENSDPEAFNLNINSPFTQIPVDNITWLEIETRGSIIIGYLDKDELFSQKYLLPLNAENVELLADSSVMYTQKDNQSDNAKLFIIGAEGRKLLKTLTSTEAFTSIIYSPAEDLFYYSAIDSSGFFYIRAFNSYVDYDLFKSNKLGVKTKISYIDANKNEVHLQADNQTCFLLNLDTKDINNHECKNIIRNDLQTNFYITNASLMMYKLSSQSERSILHNIDSNSLKLNLQAERLFYSVNSNSPIQEININSLENKLLTNSAPESMSLDSIFVMNSKVFVLGLDNQSNSYKVQRYLPEGVLSYTGEVFWAETALDIQNITSIRLITQDYFLL